MKLQKQNVVYRVEDPEKIQQLKAQGFKEVREKVKMKGMNPNKNEKDEE